MHSSVISQICQDFLWLLAKGAQRTGSFSLCSSCGANSVQRMSCSNPDGFSTPCTPLILLRVHRVSLTPRSGELAMPSGGRNHVFNAPQDKASYPGEFNDCLLDDHALVRPRLADTYFLGIFAPNVSPAALLNTSPALLQLITSAMGSMPARPAIDVGTPYHWSGHNKGGEKELGKVDPPIAKPRFGQPPVKRFDKGDSSLLLCR